MKMTSDIEIFHQAPRPGVEILHSLDPGLHKETAEPRFRTTT